MEFLKLYLLFWLFSIIGWIMEVIVCSFCDKRIVNRGFLIGPYCPIYGFGALIMLMFTPYKDQLFVCFILALVFCSVLEYLASYLMEKIFAIRWWDYSNDSFNINGRICLRNAIAFGGLGVIFTRYLNPWYYHFIDRFSYQQLLIISIIIAMITTIDLLISFNAMHSIKKGIINNLEKYQKKDATDDIKKLVNKKLLNYSFFEKRLIKTYHLLEKEKNIIRKKLVKVNAKTKNGYGLLLVFIFIGLIIGIILSFILNLASYKIIMPYTISISTLIAIMIMRVGEK